MEICVHYRNETNSYKNQLNVNDTYMQCNDESCSTEYFQLPPSNCC